MNLGVDTGKFTQTLFWQIHDYACGNSPNTVIGVQNMVGGPNGQTFYFQTSGHTWTAPYVEGATNTFKIVAVPSDSGGGSITFYLDGKLIGSATNVNTFACGAKPWWNFSLYDWDWTNGNAVSSLTMRAMLFNYMRLSAP